jgi:DNA modification methylase
MNSDRKRPKAQRGRAKKNVNPFRGRPQADVAYTTRRGRMYYGNSHELLTSAALSRYHGKINLIFTSPPFPLNTKKRYGNETGEEYVTWLCSFGPLFKKMLADNGSIVIEMGNSWEAGAPVMSTLAVRALLEFQAKNGFHLCQEFIYQNPARLPGPAQWVNVERIRVKDSFTKLWWMASTVKPKANNMRVLQEYSPAMRSLLKTKKYNSGTRPSEHYIGKTSFLKDHGGAIPSNVLTFANTHSTDAYQQYCRDHDLRPHPARMPMDLAKFFVRFLTEPGDLVLDPFAGSNTTGAVAEALNRYWIGIEASPEYIKSSKGRFSKVNSIKRLRIPKGRGQSLARAA